MIMYCKHNMDAGYGIDSKRVIITKIIIKNEFDISSDSYGIATDDLYALVQVMTSCRLAKSYCMRQR